MKLLPRKFVLIFALSTALIHSVGLASPTNVFMLTPGQAPLVLTSTYGGTVTVGCAAVAEPVPPVCYIQRTTDVNGYALFSLVQPSPEGPNVIYQDQHSYSSSKEEGNGTQKMVEKIKAYSGTLCNSQIKPVCTIRTTLDANSHPTFAIVQRYQSINTGSWGSIPLFRKYVNSAGSSQTERALKDVVVKLSEFQDSGICAIGQTNPQASAPAAAVTGGPKKLEAN